MHKSLAAFATIQASLPVFFLSRAGRSIQTIRKGSYFSGNFQNYIKILTPFS